MILKLRGMTVDVEILIEFASNKRYGRVTAHGKCHVYRFFLSFHVYCTGNSWYTRIVNPLGSAISIVYRFLIKIMKIHFVCKEKQNILGRKRSLNWWSLVILEVESRESSRFSTGRHPLPGVQRSMFPFFRKRPSTLQTCALQMTSLIVSCHLHWSTFRHLSVKNFPSIFLRSLVAKLDT